MLRLHFPGERRHLPVLNPQRTTTITALRLDSDRSLPHNGRHPCRSSAPTKLQPTKPLAISHIFPFHLSHKRAMSCAALLLFAATSRSLCHQRARRGTGFHHVGCITRFGRPGSQNLSSHI